MSIDIEMTGSGELGPIAPGWTVQEFATPVTVGDSAGGTGLVSFAAAAREDSLFVVNNDITTTEESLGSISGVVKSVSQSGLNVGVTHSTPLAAFDASFAKIPALGAGGMTPVLDMCTQLAGIQNRLTLTSGYLYTLAGHSTGFNSAGDMVEPTVRDGVYQDYNPSDGKYYPIYYREQVGTIWADYFSKIDGKFYSSFVSGDCFSSDVTKPTSRIAFKTMLEGGNVAFSFFGEPDDSDTSTGQSVSISINYSAKTIFVGGEYRYGGIPTNYGSTQSIASLDVDAELAVFFEYTLPATFGANYVMTVKICNTSDYTTLVTATTSISQPYAYYNTAWAISGNVRAIYRNQGASLGAWIGEYEIPANYSVTGSDEINGAVLEQTATNMWQYIQDACSAYNKEIAVVNDVITARDIITRVIDITNIAGAPTVAPNMTLTGRSVEINYSNSQSIRNEEIYNARADSNRVISVSLNETIRTTVSVDGTPSILFPPTRSAQPAAGIGEYSISDGNGVNVPDGTWRYWGGKLTVETSPTASNSIDIILTAPSGSTGGVFDGESALYPGPWKLAYSSGSTDYAALSILGSGVKVTPKTLKLQSGADPEKTPQDIAKTVTNPFLSTIEQAYDRGIWAANDASGPRVVLSGSLPVSVAQGFGLIAGSRVYYRDSIYRITDATIGNLGMSFNAVRHVTAQDVDAIWAGKSIEKHDLMWEGYDLSDQTIAPLRYIGDNESVLMFLDTDVNPYYDFNGDPEISVFPDTDMNPYYEDGGNLEGEDPVYLDTDENPYDGGDGYGS